MCIRTSVEVTTVSRASLTLYLTATFG